jgi:hypothetical protein
VDDARRMHVLRDRTTRFTQLQPQPAGRSTRDKKQNQTYSERFDGGELLHDRLFLSEISCSDGQRGRGDDWQTDRHTHDQEDKGEMEQVVGAFLGGCELEVVEEASNPCCENPAHDQDQERRADGVHDSLEMALIFSSRNQGGSASDEGHLRGVCDDGIGLSTLAASSVVDNISDVLVDGEGLSSHGRLIDGEEGIARAMLLSNVVLVLSLVIDFFASLAFKLLLELCPAIGVVISGDNSGVGRDHLSVFDNDLDGPINFPLIAISQKNLQCHQGPIRGP